MTMTIKMTKMMSLGGVKIESSIDKYIPVGANHHHSLLATISHIDILASSLEL